MLFEFLLESKMIRNDDMSEEYSKEELSCLLFAMMLSIHLVSTYKETKLYCIKTLQFPKFNQIYLSSTDLANIITALRKQNIDIPVNELKRYLRGIVVGGNTPAFTRALFFRLQQRLRIKDGKLLTLRRDLVDGEGHGDDVSYGRPLYEYLRKYQNKCDVLVLLQSLMDRYMVESSSPIVPIAHQKEMSGESLRDVLMVDKKLKNEIKYLPISQLKNETHLTMWVGKKLVADLELQQNPFNETQVWLMHVAVRAGYEGNGYAKDLLTSAVEKVSKAGKKLKLSMYSDEGKKKLETLITRLSNQNPDIIISA